MVGDIYPIQINEEMSVTVSADAMEAVCRFYPAAGGTNMNVQEILRDLTAKGVKAGVDQDEILKFSRIGHTVPILCWQKEKTGRWSGCQN